MKDCTLPPRPWGGRFDGHPCGLACLRDGSELAFNQERPVSPNYMAAGRALGEAAVGGWLK